MTIQELINGLSKELSIPISRPKIYHYDRKGVFGKIRRAKNEVRNFSDTDYVKVKLALLLSELKFGTKEIKQILTEDFSLDELAYQLKSKKSIISYLLNEIL